MRYNAISMSLTELRSPFEAIASGGGLVLERICSMQSALRPTLRNGIFP